MEAMIEPERESNGPATGEALSRLQERLEELVEEICADDRLVVGERDPYRYEFPVQVRGAEEPLTSIPEVWLQRGEWDRVRAQLERTCGG